MFRFCFHFHALFTLPNSCLFYSPLPFLTIGADLTPGIGQVGPSTGRKTFKPEDALGFDACDQSRECISQAKCSPSHQQKFV